MKDNLTVIAEALEKTGNEDLARELVANAKEKLVMSYERRGPLQKRRKKSRKHSTPEEKAKARKYYQKNKKAIKKAREINKKKSRFK